MPGHAQDDAPDDAPWMRLAVITPAHNRHELTARSAVSVLAELRPTDDYIVVDDGSRPPLESTGLLPDMGLQGRLLRHETNRGVLAARNTLLRAVPQDAEWVLMLDSDDRLLPGWRVLLDGEMAAPDSVGLLWFDRIKEDEGTVDGFIPVPGQAITLDTLCSGRVRGNFIPVVRRSLIEDFAFDERAWGWEGVLWARVLAQTDGRHVPVPIATGPTNGVRADSASAVDANHAPDRARGLAIGAEEYIETLSPLLAIHYPDHYRDMRLTALTWRVIAGDASMAQVVQARADLTGATRAQQVRWLSLVAAAALPYGIRRSLLARRSRARAGSQTPSGEGD